MKSQHRNYACFLIEGALFIGGIGFVNGQTLIPAIILQEGGPSWLAALAPSMMVIGIFGAPVFTAKWIDGLERMKPTVLLTGASLRVVYLSAALIFLIPGLSERLAIWILALTPFFAGFGAGLGLTAWQRLFSGSVPSHIRPSNIAFRFLFGGLLGIGAGKIIEWTLASFPLVQGLAVLHACAFVFATVSLLVLAGVKESKPNAAETPAPVTLGKSALKEGFGDLLGPGPDRHHRLCFFLGVILMHAIFLTTPYFAAELLRQLEKPNQFLGVLAMWQMGGMALGNLLAAWFGMRWGGRFTLGLGAVLLATILFSLPLIDSAGSACVFYAIYATAFMLMIVGKDSLVLDFAPPQWQSRFFMVIGLTTMVATLGFSLLGYLLYENLENFATLAGVGACLTLGCFVATSYVREPRSDVKADPLRALYRGVLRYFR